MSTLPRFEPLPPDSFKPPQLEVPSDRMIRASIPTHAAMRLADEKPGWWVFVGEQPQGHYAADSLRLAKRNGYETAVRQLGPSRHAAYLRRPER